MKLAKRESKGSKHAYDRRRRFKDIHGSRSVKAGVAKISRKQARTRRYAFELNGKPIPAEEGRALVARADRLVRERQRQNAEQARLKREKAPAPPTPEQTYVTKWVRSVEARIVQAVWTERCLPGGGAGGSCGIAYIHDRAEIFANAVAQGDWKQPHPGSPSPRAIDTMSVPLGWLSFIRRELAEIVRAAAGSKRGNPEANVSWGEVKAQVPAVRQFPVQTLQRRYDEGLSEIAARVLVGD